MRIALFSETYVPEVNGVVAHVKVLKEGLEQLGHQVLVVTTDAKTHTHYVRKGVLYCPGKQIKKVYGYGAALPINAKRYKYLKQFDPDVIHIHTEFGIGLFGLLAAKLLKKPIVYTLHTIYDEYLYYLLPNSLTRAGKKVFYKYIRYIANNANIIIGPSKKSYEFLRRAGVNKNLEIISNGVDIQKFSPYNISQVDKNKLRDDYNIPRNCLLACTVTRLGKEKSVDVLLKYSKDYIAKNDNFYLLIVGDGPAKRDLETLAAELGIANKVVFTGKVLNQYLISYYGACDVFITASLTDTNSISMLEAMAMGLPVLQRYDEVNKDQIIEGVNGYTFTNSNSMAEILSKLANMDYSKMLELKHSVRESVVNKGIKDVAKNVLEQYNRLV